MQQRRIHKLFKYEISYSKSLKFSMWKIYCKSLFLTEK